MKKKYEIIEGDRSGISIRHVRSKELICVHGWYDTFVGIEGFSMPLSEFLERLGVNLHKTVTKAAILRERKRCANLVASLDGLIEDDDLRSNIVEYILRGPIHHARRDK